MQDPAVPQGAGERAMQLLIVIVNYRTPKLVVDCLRSLAGQIDSARVIVTDNLSGDDSIQILSQAMAQNGWSTWASLMSLDRNGGFAAGNNAVIAPEIRAGDP